MSYQRCDQSGSGSVPGGVCHPQNAPISRKRLPAESIAAHLNQRLVLALQGPGGNRRGAGGNDRVLSDSGSFEIGQLNGAPTLEFTVLGA